MSRAIPFPAHLWDPQRFPGPCPAGGGADRFYTNINLGIVTCRKQCGWANGRHTGDAIDLLIAEGADWRQAYQLCGVAVPSNHNDKRDDVDREVDAMLMERFRPVAKKYRETLPLIDRALLCDYGESENPYKDDPEYQEFKKFADEFDKRHLTMTRGEFDQYSKELNAKYQALTTQAERDKFMQEIDDIDVEVVVAHPLEPSPFLFRRWRAKERLARELQAEGARRRQGHVWDVTQVSRIVRSSTYAGIHRWRDIETPLPAIVDRDTQERAKAVLKRNKVFYSGRPGQVYPLRSIVKCGFCQRLMSGITVKSGTSGRTLSYYRCTAKAIDCSPCPGSYVPARELENLVLGQARRMVAGKDLTDDIRTALKLGADRRGALESYRQEQLAKLSDAEDSIARNQEELVRGQLTEAAYDRLYAKLKAESVMFQERLEAAEKELKFIPPRDAEKTIQLHMGRAQRALRESENISQELKQEIFRAFVTNVTVKVRKGERLQRIAQGKVDVQLILASAGTDLDKLLPLMQKESPYMPGVEQVWIELGLNVHTYDPNGDDGWESEDDRISHQDRGKPLR